MKLKIIKGILKDQFTGIAPTTLYSIIQRDTSAVRRILMMREKYFRSRSLI